MRGPIETYYYFWKGININGKKAVFILLSHVMYVKFNERKLPKILHIFFVTIDCISVYIVTVLIK